MVFIQPSFVILCSHRAVYENLAVIGLRWEQGQTIV